MPGDNTKKTKKAGPVKPGAAKKVQKTRAQRKEGRAVKASNKVAEAYMEALKEGKPTNMVLAIVTGVAGGGRFSAFDLVNKQAVVAKVSKKLFTKKAKHRNAVIPIAVHVDSYVILDEGDAIKAVVGEREAFEIRQLLFQSEEEENNIFNRGSVSNKNNKNNKSNKNNNSSRNSRSSTPKVSMNNL
jgi:hypothetical protein